VRGQANRWYEPQQRRELERLLLQRANDILRQDRRRVQGGKEEIVIRPPAAPPEPVSRNGWIHLADLKYALRKNGGSK
jgi:hypothetical protein